MSQTFCPTDQQTSSILARIAEKADIPLADLQKSIGFFFTGIGRKMHQPIVNKFVSSNSEVYDTDEQLMPTMENSIFRFLILHTPDSTAATLKLRTDTPEKANIDGLVLDGNTLTSGTYYTFDVPAVKGWRYNLVPSQDGTFDIILVVELPPSL